MNNRPIRFRIWVKSEKKMYGWYGNQSIIKDAIPDDADDEWTEDCILMQDTTLLDCNGQSIYEGDILLYEAPNNKLKTIFVIYWNDKAVGFKVKRIAQHGKLTGPEMSNIEQMFKCKIIGNIHQNRKLLNENY